MHATCDLFFLCTHRNKFRILIQDFKQNFPLLLYFLVGVYAEFSWLAAKEHLVAATEMPARSAISFMDLSFA